MENILTREEKIYLNRTCNYLASLGMSEGQINFDLDYEQDELTHDDINWEYINAFEYNYLAELPEGLIPILKKIMGYFIDKNIFTSPDDVDSINFNLLYINIDCEKKEISINQQYSYYYTANYDALKYGSNEDKERFDRWMEEDMKDVEVPSNGILTVIYNGGGDEGHIEGSFMETNERIPESITNWCYDQLEESFEGWEDNEGSDGRIIFNFNNSTVLIEINQNGEETEIITWFKENFSV